MADLGESVMEINMEIIAQAASLVLLIATTVLGAKFAKYKNLVKKIVAALDDGTITKEEVRGIVTLWTNGKV